MNMIMSDSSSYSCQFYSPYGFGYTSTIWFNQVRIARTGVADTCPNNFFAFSVGFQEFRSGIFKFQFRFGMMGKGGYFTQSRSVGAPGSEQFSTVTLIRQ